MDLSIKTGVNMSRLRWGLAAAIAALAFIAATQSMATYQAHGMTVGLLAVVSLAILLVVGLASLGLARVRVGRELIMLRTGAGAGVDAGELLSARRRRLQQIKAAGARPDREALAESTRATEAGRAYIGRYLVASTVLLGLVGTFAGLMQALGKLAPLFGDKDLGGLALLAAPLAGLHVTFGASLVAILATLALAIAQGDLSLCEDQALALLEDRTTHELIPALWPPVDDAGERTVRAVEQLKAVFADALTRSIDASLKRMAESARGEADRASHAIETIGTTLQREIARLCTTVSAGLDDSARRQTDALVQATRRQNESLSATTALVGKQLGDVAETVLAGLRSQVEQVVTGVADAARTTAERTAATLRDTLGASTTAFTETAAISTAAIEETTRSSATAIKESTQFAIELHAETLQRSTLVADGLLRATSESVERGARATSESVARTLEPLFASEAARLDDVRGAVDQAIAAVQSVVLRIADLTSSFADVARQQVAAMDRNGQAVVAAFDRVVVGGGEALAGAAGALAIAARDLRSGTEALGPRLTALANELGALGREVALLIAARGPEGDMDAVVLGELDRLGSGVDRLTALLRVAEESRAPAASGQPSTIVEGHEDVVALGGDPDPLHAAMDGHAVGSAPPPVDEVQS